MVEGRREVGLGGKLLQTPRFRSITRKGAVREDMDALLSKLTSNGSRDQEMEMEKVQNNGRYANCDKA